MTIGRMLSLDEAARLIRRIERQNPKRPPALSLKRRAAQTEAGLRKTPLSFCFSEALAHRMLDPVVVGALVPAAAAAAALGHRSWSARRLRRDL